MPALIDYLRRTTTEWKRVTLTTQWDSAVKDHVVTCTCGQPRAIEHAYRCLYCGIWFCVSCAERHFGKTIKEYREENSETQEETKP